jgi:hypothetical protein
MEGLAFDPTTAQLYGVSNTAGVSSLYRINTDTGAATLVGSIGTGNFQGLEFLREPSIATLTLIAAAGLMARPTRRGCPVRGSSK